MNSSAHKVVLALVSAVALSSQASRVRHVSEFVSGSPKYKNLGWGECVLSANHQRPSIRVHYLDEQHCRDSCTESDECYGYSHSIMAQGFPCVLYMDGPLKLGLFGRRTCMVKETVDADLDEEDSDVPRDSKAQVVPRSSVPKLRPSFPVEPVVPVEPHEPVEPEGPDEPEQPDTPAHPYPYKSWSIRSKLGLIAFAAPSLVLGLF
eukprot:TRINITY_DN39444_c0_g1_i1.p2 TRINITY_DN39444_c0_g1~~TRINITY_DN39444_c0_g1_i1.p2  ORF type:complete len:206 (-),score=15.22 TRINITY_DN39444_c0_g1_i1:121-738(-)